jgi:hypothetical protein
LVYSLTTPLNSSAAEALPLPSPKPHIPVLFAGDYTKENMIPGNPPLQISRDGLLTVSPSEPGLFVFSILVEEYRNQVKIGETRRDFQMLAIDECEPPDPPEVAIDIPGQPDFDPLNDILEYTVGESKCFDFLVSNVTEGETISLRAEGVNFPDDINEIFSLNDIPVGPDSSELLVEICIPDCPPLRDQPFIIDLIAADDACPLPQLDTMRITVNVTPPDNSFPEVSPVDPISGGENSRLTRTFSAIDIDGDSLTASLFVNGFEDPKQVGIDLVIEESGPGNLTGLIEWNTDCQIADFSTNSDFIIGLIVDDLDTCDIANPDTLFFDASVILPPNTSPVIEAPNAPNQ